MVILYFVSLFKIKMLHNINNTRRQAMENVKELCTMCTRCKILILKQLPLEVCILK